MGILSSLYTAVSGVEAYGTALGVVADNIANANTVGFKTSRAEFEDVIARSIKGDVGGNQIGRGTHLGAVKQIFSQGSLVQTERPTDLAISGGGFFVLDGLRGQTFTRNGAFNFNREGQLVNSGDEKVLGFKANENGKFETKLSPIKIEDNVIGARETSQLNLAVNLDVRSRVVSNGFDLNNADKTSSYSTSVNIVDSVGNSHAVKVYFTRLGDNTWDWNAVGTGRQEISGEEGKKIIKEDQSFIGASGTIEFGSSGQLSRQTIDSNSFNFGRGAASNQQVEFLFGNDKDRGIEGLSNSTQYGSANDVYENNQNGYAAGSITGLSFSDEGILSASYSNGITKDVSQIALAKFQNNEGLHKLGSNLFQKSISSGEANLGSPARGGRGKIFARTVESSTTDIASEFVSLIKLQRAFQANARTMTASDELMQEILNIRRG